MKNTVLLVAITFLSACSPNEERYLGKKKVEGSSTIYVKFYQTDKYDMATPLHYEIVDQYDSILVRKTFIVGTHDKLSSAKDLYAGVYDSIFFISYPTHEEVYILKDLKKNSKRKKGNLFSTLKSYNPTLIEM